MECLLQGGEAEIRWTIWKFEVLMIVDQASLHSSA